MLWIAACAIGWIASTASAQSASETNGSKLQDDGGPASRETAPRDNSSTAADDTNWKLRFLPPSISDGLEVNLWGWLGYGFQKSDEWDSYWDGQLQLDVTKSFSDRFAVTADMNFIDANNRKFGQLEQLFATAIVSEQWGTLLTAGKFNASFGVEPRDFWNRTSGTTSLLFGAQPQDMIGIMLTQPIGQTGLKIRPFVVNQFEGRCDFDQPPSAGITVEFRPGHEWTFSVTNWVGPGFVRREGAYEESPGDDSAYRFRPSEDSSESSEYSGSGAGYSGANAVIAGNWLGPDLQARRGGTLYFLDAKAVWLATPALTVSGEGLFGTTGSSSGRASWGGLMLLASYDLTDRWRIFGRWSFLNDADGIITGTAGRRHELSAGVGFQVMRNVELRTEYRHDFSSATDDVDSVSVHLSFGI